MKFVKYIVVAAVSFGAFFGTGSLVYEIFGQSDFGKIMAWIIGISVGVGVAYFLYKKFIAENNGSYSVIDDASQGVRQIYNAVQPKQNIVDFDNIANEALQSVKADKNYEVLGIPANSSMNDVKERCKELLKEWHPDLHKHDPDKHKVAIEKIKEFKAAYESIVSKVNTKKPPLNQASSQTPIKPVKPQVSQSQSTYSSTEGKPWRRYWARMIDITFIGLPMVLLLVLLLPDFLLSAKKQFGDLIIGIIALPLIILCEAIILGTTGTTFGKWLLNIKIVSKTDNQNISFFDALKRTVLLWVKGLGFGLPIINFIPMVLAARRIKKNGTASWDDSISAVVKCSPLNALDVVIAVLAVLVLLFVNGIVSEVAGVK